MKKSMVLFFTFAAVVAFSCAGQQSKTSGKSGVLTISGIPPQYIDGLIFVSGENDEGDKFTYSPKYLQKITDTTMDIKIYSSVSATQTEFLGNGPYSVTVELYTSGAHENSETLTLIKNFKNGSADIEWNLQ